MLRGGRSINSDQADRLDGRQILNGLIVPPFQGLENILGTLTRAGAHVVRLLRAIIFRAFSPCSLGLVDSAAVAAIRVHRYSFAVR